jgi:hypothetical protein
MVEMRIILISLLGLWLTACSAAVTPTALTPVAPETPPPPTIEPLPADVLAIYRQQGCFVGLDETLIVHFDGTLSFAAARGTAQQTQIKVEELAELQDLLAQPEFAELQALYQAVGADLCVYTITARRAGQSFSVTTMDGAATPEFLQRVIDAAARLRRRIKA